MTSMTSDLLPAARGVAPERSWRGALRLRRSGLLASTCLAVLGAGSAALADDYPCPPASSTTPQTCTIPDNVVATGMSVDFTGAAGSGNTNGAGGGQYTFQNSTAITTDPGQNEALFLRLRGGRGNDDTSSDGTRGGDGGIVGIVNTGAIQFGYTYDPLSTTEGSDDGSLPGVWDDPGRGVAIYGASIGGAGGGQGNMGVGGGSGGNGGHAGTVDINNSGTLTMNGQFLPNGGAGILGTVVTGAGGDQDDQAFGDQKGGDAGDGNPLTITNSGVINFFASGGGHYLWGIGGENIGGVGGFNNGNGGAAGSTTITNSASISVSVAGASSPFDAGVRGIYASSFGGPGTLSEDGSDDGGRGEESSAVTVTTNAGISVSAMGLTLPTDGYRPTTNNASTDTESPAANPEKLGLLEQSGGIVAIAKGGDGGSGPQTAISFGDQYGGTGAFSGPVDVTVANGATVSTSNNYLPGIVAISAGGLGGDGREDSKGAAAGAGGVVTVTITGGSGVQTSGTQSYGVAARSQGGNGGDYIPSSGFVDFSPEDAGNGGSGGGIVLQLGDTTGGSINPGVSDPSGRARITTNNDYSVGIIGQSFGGAGGATGDSFDLLGQVGASTGNGGAGGTVFGVGGVDVVTKGSYSRGIVLQSVGGNGGLGGDSDGIFALGGAGGVGGAADAVTGLFAGTITTSGDAATGILAQSVGGGGGSAEGTAGVFAVGGQGGSGGATSSAAVSFLGGTVSTGGDYAYGIEVQSVGGGGGDGGSAFTVAGLSAMPTVGIGGTGGVAGDGAQAYASNKDDDGVAAGTVTLTTAGDNAHAVLAQSIGGGGGSGGEADGGDLTIASFQMAGGGNSGGKGGAAVLDFDGLGVNTSGAHAAGLVAQSVGGGGGTGGSAYAHTVSAGFGLAVGVGGEGGNGGNGGTATVTLLNTTISTGNGVGKNGNTSQTLTDAHGIVAQSIGGGGGMAGSATARAIVKTVPATEATSFGAEVSVAVGGNGGSGGSGGTVDTTLDNAQVVTRGDGSVGIVAQSIGGGGGIGGSADALGGILGNPFASSGESGNGNSGGDGGANGKSAAEADETPPNSTTYSANVNVGIGGSGGTGGSGGSVSVALSNAASVTTWGDQANAVLLQSIGGGGGSGGVGSASSLDLSEGKNIWINIGVGGTGSEGGHGGELSFDLQAGTQLITNGEGARGVLGQSIGGGGGNSQGVAVAGGVDGSPVSADIRVGLEGAGGGDGGSIDYARLAGSIVTQGADADGVTLQSIGGGGGVGGSFGGESAEGGILKSVQEFREDAATSVDIRVVVGGSGGTGGHGGDIGVAGGTDKTGMRMTGSVTTYGDFADGIVLQSVGGGGGAGGNGAAQGSVAVVRTFVGVGGKGGTGGDGGNVYYEMWDSSVSTQGVASYGLLMQSIGGGGGQGGTGSRLACGLFAVGGGVLAPDFLSDAVANTNLTDGERCHTVPSVGQIQGDGGATGNGGSIASQGATNQMTVGTKGDDSHAVLAQSIGGGGGTAAGGTSNTVEDPQGYGQIMDFGMILGGKSGASGDGGTVSLDGIFHVGTSGDRAIGLVAQSIGGGGGLATMSGASVTGLVLGGDGSGGMGEAVEISLLSGGDITTSGSAAHGVVAQSIGGGGGIGGDTSVGPLVLNNFGANVGINDSPAANSDGSAVDLTIDGTVATTGLGAFGVIAQSIGGGGGLGGKGTTAFAGATAEDTGNSLSGTVDIEIGGSVSAAGENAVGVFAQSQGLVSNDTIRVTVSGSVTGGTGEQGIGVLISGGGTTGTNGGNLLTVASGGSVSAASGVAVFYQGDTDLSYSGLDVENSGTLNGDVVGYYANGSPIIVDTTALVAATAKAGDSIPGLAAVSLLNRADGVIFGARNYAADVVNEGTFIVGENGRSDSLAIAGDFTQGATGLTVATIDFAGRNGDLISVDGDVSLDGKLAIDPLSILKGARQQILSVDGRIDGAFTSVASTLIRYEVTQDPANALWVEVVDADFNGVPGLTNNESGVARYLDRLFDASGDDYATLFAAAERAAASGRTDYAGALSRLSPGASAAGAAINAALSQERFDQLMTCRQITAASLEPGKTCLELYGRGQRIDEDGSSKALGYSADVYSLGVAGHWQGDGDFDFGGSIGIENISAAGEDGNSDVDGNNLVLGLSAARTFGAFSLTGAFAGTYGSFDTSRNVSVVEPTQADGSYDAYSAGVRLRAAYTARFDSAYVMPYLDLDAVYSSADGYDETGAGALNLAVAGSDQTLLRATPSIEVGKIFDLGDDLGLRAYGRVGYALSSEDAYTTAARFAGATPSLGGFDTSLAQSDSVALVGAGLQVLGRQDLNLDLRYDGAFGDDLSANAVSLRFSTRF